MSNDTDRPSRLLSIDPTTKAAIGRITRREHCACLAVRTKKGAPLVPNMHVEAQDQSATGWAQVTDLIERLARTNAPILEPSAQIPWKDWMRVITLALSDVSNACRNRLCCCKPEDERWAEALLIERQHGDEAPNVIASRVQGPALDGVEAGVQRWIEIATHYDQLRRVEGGPH